MFHEGASTLTKTAGTVLVLDDGRPGHRNQSLAFCRLKGLDCRVVRVRFRHRLQKLLAYAADWLRLYSDRLFRTDPIPAGPFRAVVSAGSGTYYANKVLARRLNALSVALMMPRGYRMDFDWVVAPAHDRPPARDNVVVTPVNLCHSEPQGVFQPGGAAPWIAVVLGGPNDAYDLDPGDLRGTLDGLLRAFPDHRCAVTTSPRTPPGVERLVDELPFDYRLIYSRDPRNPIPDFLERCDWVFLTPDSTSMISEAVCHGRARVVILPLKERKRGGKFQRLVGNLVDGGFVIRHSEPVPEYTKPNKIDLRGLLGRVKL